MNLIDLKNWVNNLPEDKMELPVVIRDIVEEDGNFKYIDNTVASAMVDIQQNRVCFHDIKSQQIINKIREISKPQEEQPTEEPEVEEKKKKK
jgi:hypothetical protein